MKRARVEKHLTQRQLAEHLSITTHYLMSIENKKQMPSSELLYRIIRELDLSADTIFYPEQGEDCELVSRLHILLNRFGERDIELIMTILQVLLQVKCAEGGDFRCRFNCPHI